MVDVSSFFGAFSGIKWGSLLYNIIFGAIAMIFIIAICVYAYVKLKNKMIFKTPVSLLQILENGNHKRRDDLIGGLVKQKNGVQDFVIKVPKQLKKKRLGYVPDFSKADASGRLLFTPIGDGMVWQQCVEKVVTEKEVEVEVEGEDGKINKKKISVALLAEPIPTDIKTITINNIHSVENLMDQNKFKAAAIAIGAFVLMVFVQIIFLFLTSGKK